MIFHVLHRGVGRMRLFNKERYVERNALRANLVASADQWRWSSLWRREHGTTEDRRLLGGWPLPRSHCWCELVNEPQTETEVKAIRHAVVKGQPYGSESWITKTAIRSGDSDAACTFLTVCKISTPRPSNFA